MRLIAIVGCFVLVLSGCSKVRDDPGFAHHPFDCRLGIPHDDCLPGTAGYRGDAQQQAAAQQRATNEDAQCRSYGIPPESPGYIQCRINVYNQRAQESQTGRPLLPQNRNN
jgi:hypothetical protein